MGDSVIFERSGYYLYRLVLTKDFFKRHGLSGDLSGQPKYVYYEGPKPDFIKSVPIDQMALQGGWIGNPLIFLEFVFYNTASPYLSTPL